jgi:hypothetical protein
VRVVARAELRRAAGPGGGFVEPVELIERLRDPPCQCREVASVPQFLELPARLGPELGGSGGIAGHELKVDTLSAGDQRELEFRASFCQVRSGLGEDRARLGEATEHRQRSSTKCTEPVVAPGALLGLFEPLQ